MFEILSEETFGATKAITIKGKGNPLFISFDSDRNIVNVLSMNAAHRSFRGMGRFFKSFDEAKASYKSAEAKSMIGFFEASLES